MTLLDRQGPRQLRLHVAPSSYLEALGSVVSSMPVSPRAIASCVGINTPEALLWSHRWVERCGTVLDVGAGLGGPATFMHQLRVGPTVLCEPNPRLADYAREFTGLTTVRAAADALPFADRSFGGLTALAMLSRVDDRRRSLQQMAKVVRAGGRASIWAYVSATDRVWSTPNATFTSLSEVESDLMMSGFEIVEWQTAGAFGHDPMWSEIQDQARSQLRRQYGHLPCVAAEIEENDGIAAGLASGQITYVAYRLRAR